jgi:hypothetical protein
MLCLRTLRLCDSRVARLAARRGPLTCIGGLSCRGYAAADSNDHLTPKTFLLHFDLLRSGFLVGPGRVTFYPPVLIIIFKKLPS